jgi:hypothetical protein
VFLIHLWIPAFAGMAVGVLSIYPWITAFTAMTAQFSMEIAIEATRIFLRLHP